MSEAGSAALGYVILATLGVLFGVLLSLPVLVPPIRKMCRRILAARIIAVCILGVVSFVVGLGLWARLSAEAYYLSVPFDMVDHLKPDGSGFDASKPNVMRPFDFMKPAIINELWIRLLIPSARRWPCYTNNADACAVADDLLKPSGQRHWAVLLAYVISGFIPVLTSCVCVWRFTRQKPSAARAAYVHRLPPERY